MSVKPYPCVVVRYSSQPLDLAYCRSEQTLCVAPVNCDHTLHMYLMRTFRACHNVATVRCAAAHQRNFTEAGVSLRAWCKTVHCLECAPLICLQHSEGKSALLHNEEVLA